MRTQVHSWPCNAKPLTGVETGVERRGWEIRDQTVWQMLSEAGCVAVTESGWNCLVLGRRKSCDFGPSSASACPPPVTDGDSVTWRAPDGRLDCCLAPEHRQDLW